MEQEQTPFELTQASSLQGSLSQIIYLHEIQLILRSFFYYSSSSNSRFGGKLLIPYGGSLPYGRVY